MSVLAKCKFSNSEWEFDIQPESNQPLLEVGFEKTKFKNLSFGYTVLKNNQIILQKAYPKPGVKYVSTDQKYIVAERLNLKSDEEAMIAFWAENDNQRYEDSITFTVPRPEKPYESWVWNESGYWEAPVPYPEDDKEYSWNEENQEWIKDNE